MSPGNGGIGMYIKKSKGPVFVTLKDGRTISRADLPPATTKRWVASRKAVVVCAVDAGLLQEDEACEIYGLTIEELTEWRDRAHSFGEKALKATTVQRYRQPKGE